MTGALLCQREEVGKVLSPPLRSIVVGLARCERILAYRFKQTVTGTAVSIFGDHDALFGERPNEVNYRGFVQAVVAADVLRRLQCPARKYRKAVKQSLLAWF